MKVLLTAGALVVGFCTYVLVMAVVGLVGMRSDSEPDTTPRSLTTSATPTTPSSPPTPYDEATQRGGDGAPHQAENRGHLQPGDLTYEARQRLDAEGAALLPALERVRTTGTATPDAVTAALVAAGYDRADVSVMTRPYPDDLDVEYVVFGIRADGGCVAGMVTRTEVRAEAMGPYPETGCLAPYTH